MNTRMMLPRNQIKIILLLLSFIPSAAIVADQKVSQYKNNFDSNKLGQLPKNWSVAETRSGGWFSSASNSGTIANWSITQDSNSKSKNSGKFRRN